MKTLLPLLLALAVSIEALADVDCEAIADLEKIGEICGHRYRLEENASQNNKGDRRCKMEFESAEIEGTFAPELVIEMQDREYKGTNKAELFFENEKQAMKDRGWYQYDIENVGDAAYYQVWDVHQKILLRSNKYTIGFQFTKGKKPESAEWYSPCSEKQITDVARELIDNI